MTEFIKHQLEVYFIENPIEADKIAEQVSFGEVEIIRCSGLNTTYASNGGIIVAYSK